MLKCATTCLVGVAVMIILSSTGSAQDRNSVIKDLRKESVYYVVFCARDTVPGHAFVVFGKDDAKELVCKIDGAWGYYPEKSTSGAKIALGRVPGELANEYLQERRVPEDACRLILKVDEKQYKAADDVRRKWEGKREYKILEEDCVSFATDVAKSLGLRTPTSFTEKHPQLFVRKLLELNK